MAPRLPSTLLALALTSAGLPAAAQSYTVKKFHFPAQAVAPGTIGLTRGGTLYGSFADAQSITWLFTQPVGGTATLHGLGTSGLLLSLAANDAGEFAGTLNTPTPGAFTLIGGKLTVKRVAPFSTNRGLTNDGDVLQLAANASGTRWYGLLQTGGSHKTVGYKVPGALSTWPVATNNKFAVVGYFDTKADQYQFQGFLYQNGSTTLITGPTQQSALPFAINDAGTIALQSGSHFYLFDGTSYTPIAVPGATTTVLRGLNNAGAAFGMYTTADKITHGFVYKNGTYTSIDAPPHLEIGPLLGMDDSGDVAGIWWKSPAYPATQFIATCSGTGC